VSGRVADEAVEIEWVVDAQAELDRRQGGVQQSELVAKQFLLGYVFLVRDEVAYGHVEVELVVELDVQTGQVYLTGHLESDGLFLVADLSLTAVELLVLEINFSWANDPIILQQNGVIIQTEKSSS